MLRIVGLLMLCCLLAACKEENKESKDTVSLEQLDAAKQGPSFKLQGPGVNADYSNSYGNQSTAKGQITNSEIAPLPKGLRVKKDVGSKANRTMGNIEVQSTGMKKWQQQKKK